MAENPILAFAEANGYEAIRPAGRWRGFQVFIPIYDVTATAQEVPDIGLPYVILVKGDLIRLSTPEESLEYLDECEGD